MFGFAALQAVILNKAMSLVVVAAALPSRLAAVPLADLAGQWPVVVNLLAGSLAGAWVGATWATRMRSATLYRVLVGGELLIPTIVLLFGLNLKLAGSVSLAVSLPTMLMAFARYSRDASFVVLRRNGWFVALMAAGSVAGTIVGGLLLGVVSEQVLVPLLAVVLLASAVKVWRHR